MGHLLPRCSHLQALISPLLSCAPKLPSAALLPLIVHFFPSSESVPEELPGSLSGCPSVSQGGATDKGFRALVSCSLPQAELWPQGAPKPFTGAHEATPCGSSPGPLIPHFYLQTWAPDFRLPPFPCLTVPDPLQLCSREQFILTFSRIKSGSKCFQLKFAFLLLYLPRWEQKPSKPLIVLYHCHVQQPREKFSSGKTWDRILCPTNCSCKWAQNPGCLLPRKSSDREEDFIKAALLLFDCKLHHLQYPCLRPVQLLSLRQTSLDIFLLCRKKNEPKNEPCFF